MREYYRRRLPHQIPAGHPIFLTWNLHGSIPKHIREDLDAERQRLEREPPRPQETPAQRRVRIGKSLFGRTDRFLDTTQDGPLYLREPKAARIVVDALLFGAVERYDLFGFVVMGNHVHALLMPRGNWPT